MDVPLTAAHVLPQLRIATERSISEQGPRIRRRSGGDLGDYLARVFSRTAVILVSPGGARGRHLSHTTTNLSTSFAITRSTLRALK